MYEIPHPRKAKKTRDSTWSQNFSPSKVMAERHGTIIGDTEINFREYLFFYFSINHLASNPRLERLKFSMERFSLCFTLLIWLISHHAALVRSLFGVRSLNANVNQFDSAVELFVLCLNIFSSTCWQATWQVTSLAVAAKWFEKQAWRDGELWSSQVFLMCE